VEEDLRWIRDWGFDFVRLPMDYWLWIDADWKTTRQLRPDDVLKIKESTLAKVSLYIDDETWKRFREQVFTRHGTLRKLSEEVEGLRDRTQRDVVETHGTARS
jgi:hypothetical protein